MKSTRKGEEENQTNAYILTFNQPKIPKGVKIGYSHEKVEQCITVPLMYLKY